MIYPPLALLVISTLLANGTFFPLSYYPLIITPQGGLTISQFHVTLAFIQSLLLLRRRLSLVANIVISCSVVVVALHSRIQMMTPCQISFSANFDWATFPFAQRLRVRRQSIQDLINEVVRDSLKFFESLMSSINR